MLATLRRNAPIARESLGNRSTPKEGRGERDRLNVANGIRRRDRNSHRRGNGDRMSSSLGTRKQLGDAFHGVIGQASDEVDEAGFGIGALLPAVFHQGRAIRQSRAGLGMADLDPVLCSELQRPDTLFGEVIVEASAWFGEATAQRGFLPKEITERLAQARLCRHAGESAERIGVPPKPVGPTPLAPRVAPTPLRAAPAPAPGKTRQTTPARASAVANRDEIAGLCVAPDCRGVPPHAHFHPQPLPIRKIVIAAG